MPVSIIGTAHTAVGKLEDKTFYDLLIEAGRGALLDAGIYYRAVDQQGS